MKLVTPHEAVDFIDQLPDLAVSAGDVPTRGGIRVNRKFPVLSEEEHARVNCHAYQGLAEEMSQLDT